MHRAILLSPRAEVLGASVLGMARGLESQGLDWARVLDLLHQVGIVDPQADSWYSVTRLLAFLAAVERAHGREALRAVGRAIPDTARFAPDLDTLERALRTLDVAYQVNHRGGPIGRYRYQAKGPGQGEMHCENPYPCDFDGGLLERLVARYAVAGPALGVTHRPGPLCRRLGAPACVFDLRW